jgi:hypothetical protein
LVTKGGTSSQFTKGDGSLDSSTYSTAVGANPTGSIGLAAVNGASANFIRADGAPALSQSISPTWTGNHIFQPSSGNTVFTAGNVGVNSSSPPNFRCTGDTASIWQPRGGIILPRANTRRTRDYSWHSGD